MTQESFASIWIQQAAISKLERKTDMYLSTPSQSIPAMGN